MAKKKNQNDQIEVCFKKIKKAITEYFSKKDCSKLQQTKKDKGEIFTDADREVEKLLVAIIHSALPDHSIIGEEGTKFDGTGAYVWRIDPIDNTVGFISGESEVSTSVSLKHNNEHIHSVVINLRTGDIFEANKKGSFKNGEKNYPFKGNLESKTRAISTCGYVAPANIEKMRGTLDVLFKNRYPLRISGGAALDLCHVAEGVHAAHISFGAHPWDVEAGFHIVEAAGGIVEVLQKFPERNSVAFLASANRGIHKQIKRLLGPLLEYS